MKSFKLSLVILAVAVALFLVLPNLSWAAEDGAAIYKAKCAMCHGPDGAGKGNAPAVKGKDAADVLAKGGKKAPHTAAFKGLTDDQIKAVAEYVKGLK